MSGAVSAEDATLVRAGLIGAACGLCVVFGAWALAGHLLDRLRGPAAISPRTAAARGCHEGLKRSS